MVLGSSEVALDNWICLAHHLGRPPQEKVSFHVMNHLITVDEVDPNDGFLVKPLDDLDGMDHSTIPDLDFPVVGPHYINVLPIGPLTWLTAPR